MPQNLLFFAPNHFNIDQVILSELKKSPDYIVTQINPDKYHYKNVFERIINFLGKVFLNKTLKKDWAAKDILEAIKPNAPFDLCLIFRPDLLHPIVLKYIQKNIPTRKVVYWDSFEKIPALKPTLKYFNQFYSFEKEDCIAYNLNKITNFYSHKNTNVSPQFDAFFFASKDARLPNVVKLITALRKQNLNAEALIVAKKSKFGYEKSDVEGITITDESIPFSEIYKFSENTKAVIDIAHPNQKGLSMRPYEALGLKRKLITNNKAVKEFDFYNEDNIFVIDDFDNIHIPNTFFEKPFTEINPEIRNKYHITIWLKNILA